MENLINCFTVIGIVATILGICASIYFGLSNIRSQRPFLDIVITNYISKTYVTTISGVCIEIRNPRNFDMCISEVSFGLNKKQKYALISIQKQLPMKVPARQNVEFFIREDQFDIRQNALNVIVKTQCGNKFIKTIPRELKI